MEVRIEPIGIVSIVIDTGIYPLSPNRFRRFAPCRKILLPTLCPTLSPSSSTLVWFSIIMRGVSPPPPTFAPLTITFCALIIRDCHGFVMSAPPPASIIRCERSGIAENPCGSPINRFRAPLPPSDTFTNASRFRLARSCCVSDNRSTSSISTLWSLISVIRVKFLADLGCVPLLLCLFPLRSFLHAQMSSWLHRRSVSRLRWRVLGFRLTALQSPSRLPSPAR